VGNRNTQEASGDSRENTSLYLHSSADDLHFYIAMHLMFFLHISRSLIWKSKCWNMFY